jgi:uncharacterized protein YndB with AHSA1/START domain
MTEPLAVRRETHIAAPPATVFAFLTDPEKILSWMGTEVKTEVHPGGLYLVQGVSGRVARGAFREVVPVHRLAYSFGWDGDEEVLAGSGLVEIDLIDRDGGTLLRIAVFPTRRSAPATTGVGRITLAGWQWPPPAAIPASIVARCRVTLSATLAPSSSTAHRKSLPCAGARRTIRALR